MNCRQCKRLIERYADNELRSATQRAEVERHLHTCAGCRRLLAEVSELTTFLRRSRAQEHSDAYWAAQVDKFWSEVKQRYRPVARSARWSLWSPAGAALATAAVLLIAVGVVGIRNLRELTGRRVTHSETIMPAPASGEAAEGSGETKTSGERMLQPSPVSVPASPPEQARETPAALPPTGTKSAVSDAQSPLIARDETKMRVQKMVEEAEGSGPSPTHEAPSVASAPPPLPPRAVTAREAPAKSASEGVGMSYPQISVAEPTDARSLADDSAIYAEEWLDSVPKMISLPELPDSIRLIFAGQEVRFLALIEKDGTVSEVEPLSGSESSGVKLLLAESLRHARFVPGSIGGKPVRTRSMIRVRISAPSRQK